MNTRIIFLLLLASIGSILFSCSTSQVESDDQAILTIAMRNATNTHSFQETMSASTSFTVEPTATKASTQAPTTNAQSPTINLNPTDQELKDFFFPSFSYEYQFDRIKEDINGDGMDDLIVSSGPFMAVFLLDGDQLQMDYTDTAWSARNPSGRVHIEDWTGDGIPEVIFDKRLEGGGTGIFIYQWVKSIIHCTNSCSVVWEENIAVLRDEWNTGGVYRYSGDVKMSLDESGVSTISQLITEFSFYCCGYTGPSEQHPEYGPPYDQLRVFQSTLNTYRWTGSVFELIDEQIVSLPYIKDSIAQIWDKGDTGQTASIYVTFYDHDGVMESKNDVCVLIIEGQRVGPEFGCKRDFTTVEWRDVTGNGRQEAVVATISGAFAPYRSEDIPWGKLNPLSDKFCVHERVMVYDWAGGQVNLLANIDGCVTQPDLFGVRLDDYDNDGQLEILAADSWTTENAYYAGNEMWFEPNDSVIIYEWDGSQFVVAWTIGK